MHLRIYETLAQPVQRKLLSTSESGPEGFDLRLSESPCCRAIVCAPDAASASPPRNSASGVLGILPPPPRRRESYDCEDEEDTQDMPPHPPEYHQHPQRHQHPPFQEMRQHQHHQHHRPFGAHDAVPDPDLPFPAVQPRREARSLQSEMAAYSGCGGGGGSGGGGGGSPFSAPGGVARSFNVDGSGVLLPMEEVMVEPSRKVSETAALLPPGRSVPSYAWL